MRRSDKTRGVTEGRGVRCARRRALRAPQVPAVAQAVRESVACVWSSPPSQGQSGPRSARSPGAVTRMDGPQRGPWHSPPLGSVAALPPEWPVGAAPTGAWAPSRRGDTGQDSRTRCLFLPRRTKMPPPCQMPDSATAAGKRGGEAPKPRAAETGRLRSGPPVLGQSGTQPCERCPSGPRGNGQRHRGHAAEDSPPSRTAGRGRLTRATSPPIPPSAWPAPRTGGRGRLSEPLLSEELAVAAVTFLVSKPACVFALHVKT